MSWRSLALIVLTLAAPACAAGSGEVVETSVHCVFDYAPAVPCTMRVRVKPDGTYVMSFVAADARTRFIGRPQSGWWSGKLDGRPAMGYELNRGHAVFSTRDLETTFEWWSEGSEHGEY